MKLNVIQQQRLWWSISAALALASAIAMSISFTQFQAPLRLGIDFVGGTRLQLVRECEASQTCDRPLQVGEVREILVARDLGDSTIQVVGTDPQELSIRTQTLDVDERSRLREALSETLGEFDPQQTQIDSVGPTIGEELLASGLLALLVSFAGIIVYLSVRFQFDYALFAILALVHDTFITAGLFSALGLIAGIEVNSLFLVALLTIIGFSVNDTVVIYDRIRETRQQNPEMAIADAVDLAVNQTLTRSINTTLTTLLPLLGIFLFGGETLKSFALALIVGFILGSYSSIFLASTLLAWWESRQERRSEIPAESQLSE